MKMADSNSQSVRGVVWFGNYPQRQQYFHHLLDLALVSVTVTGDCLLHQARRVFADLQPGAFRDQQSDATHLTKLQNDFGIDCVERFFDRASIAQASGFSFSMTASRPRQIFSSRDEKLAEVDNLTTPNSTSP